MKNNETTASQVLPKDEGAPAAPSAASIEGLTDARIGELYLSTKHIGHATNRELAFGRAIESEVIATQSAKQGAQPEPYAYEEDRGNSAELVFAAWFRGGYGEMDPSATYRPLYLHPAQVQADVREAVRDAVAQALNGVYYCRRVWSAWSVGTMREDDFTPAAEVDEVLDEITDAAIEAMKSKRAASTDGE